ncbi:DUF559 domain-containing protein [Salibacterium salarium]|uniref:DUF559 domain-containing protein n=1 Tax=Salibacterium salarium TaxID=284579 RepID=A0A3R9PFR3_9BACI|nr:DUF559 domain-containing protein [Salibacterium salarium]RSL29718.1 DUF559 domain-containing protein [Salibacterium salarium]
MIEIDGEQHDEKDSKEHDYRRDQYLSNFHVTTVRITTNELNNRNQSYFQKITQIINLLELHKQVLQPYKEASTAFRLNDSKKAVAVMRWQLTILSMLESGKINLHDNECLTIQKYPRW